MKLLSFSEFCQLPNGVVYQEYRPDYLDELRCRQDVIRKDGVPIDFRYNEMLPQIEFNEDNVVKDIEFREDISRWGLFRHDSQFLVYDCADIEILRNRLRRFHKCNEYLDD